MRDGAAGQHGDYALSEVIEFILLLGVIIAALGLYSVYVVPINGREDEITQMNYVEEQFTNYKLLLDGLWSSHFININSPAPGLNVTPVTTSLTMRLGTGDTSQPGGTTQQGGFSLSLFKPTTSSATISIKTTGDTFDIDSSSSHDFRETLVDFPINITSLEYRSNNYYWIQQWYSYELGGVFLSQDDGTINRISPLISITPSNNKSIVVTIVPVQITPTNGSYSSNGPVRVDTIQRIRPAYNISSSQYFNNRWVNLSYTSSDNATAAAWLNIFRDIVTREQLDASAYQTGSVYNTGSKRTTVFMNITGSNPDPQLNLVSLYVQRAECNVTFNSVASGLT